MWKCADEGTLSNIFDYKNKHVPCFILIIQSLKYMFCYQSLCYITTINNYHTDMSCLVLFTKQCWINLNTRDALKVCVSSFFLVNHLIMYIFTVKLYISILNIIFKTLIYCHHTISALHLFSTLEVENDLYKQYHYLQRSKCLPLKV